ncbi:MAG: substrate-binding domain-containing protein [Ktedonobacteraceae bacterium]|nr:substrate-binding domain-containing protein [Ktedonobacteraceae bacterium]
MSSILNDPVSLVALIGALSGIVAAVIPLIEILFNRLRKELTYRELSDVPLVSANVASMVQISLKDGTPCGKPISDADLLVLNIRNTGNTNITSSDYIGPIGFTFPHREVISVTDVETKPDSGLFGLHDVDSSTAGRITLNHPELNKQAAITLSVLLKGRKDPTTIVGHFGGLRGGRIQRYRSQKGISRRAVFLGIGVMVTLLSASVLPARTLLSSAANCASGSLAIGGSTALLPLVSTAATTYHNMCPGAMISVNENTASSKAGLSSLAAGNIQIGDSDLTSSNLRLTDNRVAAVIYVMVVNQNIPHVTDLSTKDIQGIYRGSITNWQQVGGPDQAIFVVNRTTTSGSRATFEKYILGGKMISSPPNYDEEDTSGLMAQKVANTPGAIGYVDVRDALVTPNLRTLTLGGVQAVPQHIIDDSYPLWTIEHLYTQGNPSGLTNAFIQYMTGKDLQPLVKALNYVPFNDLPSGTVNQHPSPTAPGGL